MLTRFRCCSVLHPCLIPPCRRPVLQGAQRRVFDMMNVLGVSSSLLRMIDRRHIGDKMLVYGLMLFTIVVIGTVLYWRG